MSTTPYDNIQSGVSLNSRASASLDVAVDQLLREADEGHFTAKVQLDTRTGRILYTRAASDESGTQAGLLDIPMQVVTSPSSYSIKVRAIRVRLAAYVAQWVLRDVTVNMAMRAAVESSVQEQRLLRSLFNTAMGVLVSWLEWTEESYKEATIPNSACSILIHAVLTLVCLLLRDRVMHSRTISEFLSEGSARDDLAESLSLLVALSSPAERAATIDSLIWMFPVQEEKNCLLNSVGLCLLSWIQVDPSGQAPLAIVRTNYAHSVFRMLIAYCESDSLFLSYSPELPVRQTQSKAEELRYPWPQSLLKEFNSVDCSVPFSSDGVSDGTSMSKALPLCVSRINDEWETLAQQEKESALGNLVRDLQTTAGGSADSKLQSNTPFASENASPANANGSSGKSKKRRKTEGEAPSTKSPVEKNQVLESDKERKAAAKQAKKSVRTKGEAMTPHTQSDKLVSRTPTPSHDTSNGKTTQSSLMKEDEWRHVRASNGLVKLLWTNGIPWMSPYSCMSGARQLEKVKTFSEGGNHALPTLVTHLTSLCSIPINQEKSLDPLFCVPDQSMSALAAASSARASLLAQIKRFKGDVASNITEVSRSAAFTFVTATRLHARGPKNGKEAQQEISQSPEPEVVPNISPNQRMESNDSTIGPKAISQIAKETGLPASCAYTHVLIAKSIVARRWHQSTT